MNIIKKYFRWIQKNVPTGEVEKYPAADRNGETSVKGIFIIGDLTGIPLLKLATESGKKIIDYLDSDEDFRKLREKKRKEEIYDLIIVGAGPAGVSAAIEAGLKRYSYKILESAKIFNTIVNFPKAKPIIAAPDDYKQQSNLIISDGTKESLLDDLLFQIKECSLELEEGVVVEKIDKRKDLFLITTAGKEYKALKVILAIGKSGNSRQLKTPGENLPKVFNRLIDPEEASEQDVLVVGGGDSALETAIAIIDYAKSVTISYRKPVFDRAKAQNSQKVHEIANQGKIKLMMDSEVTEIKETSVIISSKDGDSEIQNSVVYTMIGRELPRSFFRKNNIRTEGELTLTAKFQFALLLLISCVIYFGKSSQPLFNYFSGKAGSWGQFISDIFTITFWSRFITIPVIFIKIFQSGELKIWNTLEVINAAIAYLAFTVVIIIGIYLLIRFLVDYFHELKFNWQLFKYFYFISIAIFFTIVFFGGRYFGLEVINKSQSFWYTAFYSLTILIFGIRRIKVNPTRYVKLQTWTLILIQALPLFILPEILFPALGKAGFLGRPDGFIMTQVFPKESYWRSYGFILVWPLFLSNLYNSSVTMFWIIFSFIQTFLFIPFIVYKWGKGAYCGWICSCGALAETLGDEYRTLAPHGPKAKKLENLGQFVLLFAFIITGFKLLSVLYDFNIPVINEKISYSTDILFYLYHFSIDIIFAGVLGLGVYFFLSGRVWCRFGCPLAAWMHIVGRFSKYRIFSEKKKCISCNICTKVCHMGIDVMNYANKGIPMNDVECVRCSACITNCPTQVLFFGSLPSPDPSGNVNNKIALTVLDKSDWRSGL